MLLLRKLRLLSAYPRAVAAHPQAALTYLLRGRELTNLTYDIENLDELAAFVANGLDHPVDEISEFIREPLEDEVFLDDLRALLRRRPDRNPDPRFGRRLGWYAIVRALKPFLVVETGVHDGLGSALLLQALERNGSGRLLGFDVDPGSGWLVPERLRARYEFVAGDIRSTLAETLDGRAVEFFIHDSLHTYEHERFEFETALRHAVHGVVLASDNAHVTTALSDVCEIRDLRFALFVERPRDHFYPGAGLGLGVRRRAEHTSSISASVRSG